MKYQVPREEIREREIESGGEGEKWREGNRATI